MCTSLISEGMVYNVIPATFYSVLFYLYIFLYLFCGELSNNMALFVCGIREEFYLMHLL